MSKRISSKVKQRYSNLITKASRKQVLIGANQENVRPAEWAKETGLITKTFEKLIVKRFLFRGMDKTVSRWRKATNSTAPLKDYGKQVLEQQKEAYKKFGINTAKVTGTKSFNPVCKHYLS